MFYNDRFLKIIKEWYKREYCSFQYYETNVNRHHDVYVSAVSITELKIEVKRKDRGVYDRNHA